MKHDELQEDLAAHLRGGTDRMVWTNMQLGPSGSPRPDVFTVNKSYSRFRTDCYEIKVSVSDLRHDVTSGKWQSYRKFGHAVWFAFPKGLVPLELVPAECGIILRSESCWRAARKPVAQVLDSLPRDTWLKLLMDGSTAGSKGAPSKPRSSSEWVIESKMREKWGKEIADIFHDRRLAESHYQYRTDELNKQTVKVEADIAAVRERVRQSQEREQQYLDGAILDLGDALGLGREKVTAAALAGAVRSLANRLQGRGLKSAIELLQGLELAVKEPAP
ncbi:MmcB family DNA repair protein [Polaromonas sp.]|uniref:MmcB family DNA repair protein n=1 Tax=Polaromonas sp. TaxID=1869339 RepID=UPI0032657D96